MAANPTGPVFNVDFAKELEDIKLKIDEVNQLEKERLDQLTNEKEAAAGAVIQQQLEQGKFSSFLLVMVGVGSGKMPQQLEQGKQ